ncbi:MAG TPA: ATP-dependent DNA ligase [Puia sp.]|nr:ATP-dependent DNA ligase [Puia sp.]
MSELNDTTTITSLAGIPDKGGMRLFAELFVQLGTSTKTNDKLEALTDYFAGSDDRDKVWVIALFSGRKPKRTVNATQLAEWSREITGLPAWLFEESYHTVGDLAETIALLLPEPGAGAADIPASGYNLSYYLEKLMDIGKEPEPVKKDFVLHCWEQMNRDERLVFNKLITGGFRIGISQKMIVNALAKTVGVSPSIIAHRISGNWDPSTQTFAALLSEEGAGSDISRPYPFYLAYALEGEVSELGEPGQWQAEWKWDGIRGELIRREDQLFVWSRGEELMTEKFPEYQELKERIPVGTVLDGEIIGLGSGLSAPGQVAGQDAGPSAPASTDGQAPGPIEPASSDLDRTFIPLPFAALQTRIGRKNVTRKQLNEVPVGFIAYDLLEYEGVDWRDRPLEERRAQLEKVVGEAGHALLQLSPIISFHNWQELAAAREQSRGRGSEGIMLKKKTSVYQVGRKRGDWWKWKIDPLVIDAVMVYAQKGHGRRSNLYTDYTFAVQDGDKLVTFTKAYSGLTDKELGEVDAFVKRNSLEKFGPVRTVKPELVFEIAFEGIAASGRHKSGVALRFPRINRWRRDKKVNEINTLADLQQLLQLHGK